MFFNSEVKEKFIKDYMRSRVVMYTSLTGLFNKTAYFEDLKGKDCCNFSQKEIIEMYKEFQAKSVNVLENYNVHLKSYTAYCIYNNICIENHYTDITKELLLNCIDPNIQKQKFITREQLDDIEDELYNWTDKAIIECLWNGISGKSMEDLVSLNRSMISADKKYIWFNDNRKIEITPKLYEYLNKAFDEDMYVCYGEVVRVRKLNGQDCLYKEMDNAHTLDSDDKFFRWVYRRIMTYKKYVGLPMLTMKNIQASGLLHKIKEGMEQNNLELREFLYTDEGKILAQQYGYNLNSYVDVLSNKFMGVI